MHEVLFAASANLFNAHSVQSVLDPSPLYLPAGQSLQYVDCDLDPDPYLPSVQGMQLFQEEKERYRPLGHNLHEIRSTGSYPKMQSSQDDCPPSGWYLPPGQFLQLVCVYSSWYLPGAHKSTPHEQEVRSCSPGSLEVQEVGPEEELKVKLNLPAAQALQYVCPIKSWYLPLGQPLHEDDTEYFPVGQPTGTYTNGGGEKTAKPSRRRATSTSCSGAGTGRGDGTGSGVGTAPRAAPRCGLRASAMRSAEMDARVLLPVLARA